MSEIIVVTSGKGGVGKTTATVNLGAALAARRKKTVLIDTDIGLRNLDVVMGLENRIIYNLIDIVEEKCSMKQALVQSPQIPDLYLLPAAQLRDKNSIQPEQMRKLTERLSEVFDYILIDCPAGIEQGFRNAAAPANHALVVATPDVSSVRDADRVIGLLKQSGLRKIDLVLNRVRPELSAKGDLMTTEEILEILGVDLIAVVPQEDQVLIASNRGETVAGTDSPAGKAFENLARRIEGETVEFLDLMPSEEKKGLLRRFSAWLHNE